MFTLVISVRRLLLTASLLCLYAAVCRAAGNETINTLPDPTTASFLGTGSASYQNFARNESPAVLRRYFPRGFVLNGGIHATAASCTSAAFATEAVTRTDSTFATGGNRVRASSAGTGGAVAINYSAVGANCANPGSGTARVAICAISGNSTGNWQRAAGSNYFVNAVDTTPDVPSDCQGLMDVTFLNGAVTAVSDRRLPASASVSNVYDPMDPLYGAKCDGTTDDSTALQAMINAAKVTSGVMTLPPLRTCTYGTSLVLDDTTALRLEGPDTVTGGAGPTSVLRYTGTGTAISAKSVNGLGIKNLYITGLSIDGTHFLIDTSHSSSGSDSAYLRIENNYLSANAASGGVLSLDKTISSTIKDNHFVNGVFGIRGSAAAGGYSNAISIEYNTFHNNKYAIQNAGQSYSIFNNTFEGTGSNFVGAYADVNGWAGTSPAAWIGNWFGDSPGTTVWINPIGSHSFYSNSVQSGLQFVNIVNSNPVTLIGNTYANITGLHLDTAIGNDNARFYSFGNLLVGTATEVDLNGLRPYIGFNVRWNNTIGTILYRALEVLYGGIDGIFIGPSILAPSSLSLYLMSAGSGAVLIRNYADDQDVVVAGGSSNNFQSRVRLSPRSKDDVIDFETRNVRRGSIGTFGLINIGTPVQTIANTDTILADSCGGLKQISSAGAVSTNATNAFTVSQSANASCVMHVCNTGGFTITLKRSANFLAVGGADVVLGASCCLDVANLGTVWSQVTAQLCAS